MTIAIALAVSIPATVAAIIAVYHAVRCKRSRMLPAVTEEPVAEQPSPAEPPKVEEAAPETPAEQSQTTNTLVNWSLSPTGPHSWNSATTHFTGYNFPVNMNDPKITGTAVVDPTAWRTATFAYPTKGGVFSTTPIDNTVRINGVQMPDARIDSLAGASEEIAAKSVEACEDHARKFSLARKLLQPRPLKDDERFFVETYKPEGAYVVGDQGGFTIYSIPIRGGKAVVHDMTDRDEVEAKMLEVACHPTEKREKLLRNKQAVIERIARNTAKAMRNEEDTNVLHLCRFAVEAFEKKLVRATDFDHTSVLAAFQKVEQDGYKVSHVVVPLGWLRTLRSFGPDVFMDADVSDFNWTGVRGFMYGAEVYASIRQPHDFALFAAALKAGEMATRESGFSGTARSMPEKLKHGAIIAEEMGMAINNPLALSGIVVKPSDPPTDAIKETTESDR